MNIYGIVAIIALFGFIISTVIRHTKKVGQTLVCPLDFNCDSVIHSSYSKFFGIDVATLGIIYYGGITSLYAFFWLFPSILPESVHLIGFFLSVLAVLFSLLLLTIQAIVIREWCFWCIVSAFISGAILIISTMTLGENLQFLLLKYQAIISVVHMLVVGLGVGAALVVDLFFIKFLKDYRISYSESNVLNGLSQIIWLALGILLITAFAIFFPLSIAYLAKTKFIAKLFVVGVIVINWILMNLIIMPKLVKASFDGTGDTPDLQNLRRSAHTFGVLSLVSWIVMFILSMVRSTPFSSGQIIAGYSILVIVIVIIVQYIDYRTMQPISTNK